MSGPVRAATPRGMAGFWASFFGLVRPASLHGRLTAQKPEQRPSVCLFLARSQSKSGDIGPNPYRCQTQQA